MSLKRAAAASTKWTAISSIATIVLQALQIIMVARFVTPADLGLVAMVTVVLSIFTAYIDMGISNAIIHHQDTSAEKLSSLYWLNIVSGLCAFLVAAALSPLIALMFNEPRLQQLVLIAASVFLFVPFGQQFEILLQKGLRFDTLARVEILKNVIGCVVAVGLAWLDYGAVSLIFGQIALSATATLCLLAIGWRRWPPRLRFRLSDTRGYLGFGLYQMGERTVSLMNARVDQLIIGVMLGPIPLGVYSLSWNLVIQPVQRINPIITRVAFPVFSLVQTDLERLKRGYLFVTWALSALNAPLLLGCAVTAPVFMPLLFGGKWDAAIPIVQILSFVALMRSTTNPLGSLLMSLGHADLGFKWNLTLLFTQAIIVLLGSLTGQLIGIAIAVAISQLLYAYPAYYFLVRRMLGPCGKAYLFSMLPSFATALAAAAVTWAASTVLPGPLSLTLLIEIVIGLVVYGVLFYATQRHQVRELAGLLRRRKAA
jgi:O-antigen/teichoic acid export membrane protein